MEERICPKCGRKFKVVIGKEQAIVIPQESKKMKDCPECGQFGKKE